MGVVVVKLCVMVCLIGATFSTVGHHPHSLLEVFRDVFPKC